MELTKSTRRSRILLGEPRSSSFQRVAARLIDLTILAVLFFMGTVIWLPLGWLAAVYYAGIQDSLGDGQSIGKKVIGLQVIEDHSGLPCSIAHSILRNAPLILTVFCLPIPVVGVLMQFITIPIFCLELYLLVTIDSGIRLGDVMGNTVVIEHFQDDIEALH